tara:strand:+ start:4597 stop:6030 length:1434 start_codon:yes stop_codon:yes gene_type:complete
MLQLKQLNEISRKYKSFDIIIIALATDGLKNTIIWSEFLKHIPDNVLLFVWGPKDPFLETLVNVKFVEHINPAYKYYAWCDASLVYLLFEALHSVREYNPSYIFVISGTCIPIETKFNNLPPPSLEYMQWIRMDKSIYDQLVQYDEEFLWNHLRIWSIDSNPFGCPDEVWFSRKNDILKLPMDYFPGFLAYRNFESSSSPHTFTTANDPIIIRLWSSQTLDDVITLVQTKLSLNTLIKLIGTRKVKNYMGDIFMYKKETNNVISLINNHVYPLLENVTIESPLSAWKCTDISDNNITCVDMIDESEKIIFKIDKKTPGSTKWFLRKVDLVDERNIKEVLTLLKKYCWNELDRLENISYSSEFVYDTRPLDNFAQIKMLDDSIDFLRNIDDIDRIKKYKLYPSIIISSILKAENSFNNKYDLKKIDIFPLLSLDVSPFDYAFVSCSGDWKTVYRKIKKVSYEEFCTLVDKINPTIRMM